MKKGFIIFYVNYFPEGQSVDIVIDIIRNQNKEWLEKLRVEQGYEAVFVPTVKEASRVEKVDFDQPFPRFVPNSTRVQENEEE